MRSFPATEIAFCRRLVTDRCPAGAHPPAGGKCGILIAPLRVVNDPQRGSDTEFGRDPRQPAFRPLRRVLKSVSSPPRPWRKGPQSPGSTVGRRQGAGCNPSADLVDCSACGSCESPVGWDRVIRRHLRCRSNRARSGVKRTAPQPSLRRIPPHNLGIIAC